MTLAGPIVTWKAFTPVTTLLKTAPVHFMTEPNAPPKRTQSAPVVTADAAKRNSFSL